MKKRIPDIFENVKRDVRRVLGKHRAGLTLGFVEMGVSERGFVGGMYFSGGTMILMNVTALRVLLLEVSRDDTKTEEIIEAYLYHVLMHEYIHALGYLEERRCRELTLQVSSRLFKEDHPVMRMASGGIGTYFPRFTYATPGPARPNGLGTIELIQDFDKGSTVYYM